MRGSAPSPAAGEPAPAAPAADAPAAPLAGLAAGGGLLMPTQRLDLAAGVAAPPGGSEALLRRLDEELAFALGERRLASWRDAATAERLARTNPTYSLQPRALALPVGRGLRAGADIEEPLASQLRTLAALADRRAVLVPQAVRLEPGGAGDGTVRAVVQVALVDVRLAKVLWVGATAPLSVDPASSALAPRLAARVADLLAAPPEP